MSWAIAGWSDFLADDAVLLLAELTVFELQAVRREVSDADAYAELYAEIFGATTPLRWVYARPPLLAAAIDRYIREVGLYVLADDTAAMAHLAATVNYTTGLPPIPAARPGPVYTPSRLQQIENRAAFLALVHKAGAVSWAMRLNGLDLGPVAQAETLRRQASAIFACVIAEAGERGDPALRHLRQLFATTMAVINRRAFNTSDDSVMFNANPQPSLVCAHWAWRDATQVQIMRDSNPTAHPNFMATQLAVPQ